MEANIERIPSFDSSHDSSQLSRISHAASKTEVAISRLASKVWSEACEKPSVAFAVAVSSVVAVALLPLTITIGMVALGILFGYKLANEMSISNEELQSLQNYDDLKGEAQGKTQAYQVDNQEYDVPEMTEADIDRSTFIIKGKKINYYNEKEAAVKDLIPNLTGAGLTHDEVQMVLYVLNQNSARELMTLGLSKYSTIGHLQELKEEGFERTYSVDEQNGEKTFTINLKCGVLSEESAEAIGPIEGKVTYKFTDEGMVVTSASYHVADDIRTFDVAVY